MTYFKLLAMISFLQFFASWEIKANEWKNDELAIKITSTEFDISHLSDDKKDLFKAGGIICVGNSTLWRSVNHRIYSLIEDTKVGFSDLFFSLSDQDHEQNCFDPLNIPFSAQKNINRILLEIEETPILYAEHRQEQNELEDKADNQINSTRKEVRTKGDPHPFALRNEDEKMIRKLGRAEMFIGGVQIFGLGMLVALPKEFTHWESISWKQAFDNIKNPFSTAPVYDKDGIFFNYLAHPYTGALYFNALRSQGATRLQSFFFSAFQSTFWEFFIEKSYEKPSIQDLFITPIGGSLIGEVSHQATLKMRKNGFNWWEKALVIVINPMYVVNNGFRKN